MRFSFVTFVTSLALIQSLCATPIDETGKQIIASIISTNGNALSGAHTTEAVDATCTSNNDMDDSDDEPILTRTKKHADTPQSSDNVSFQCLWAKCNQEFNDLTALSKHIDKSHIVKGQKYYKCNWENCNFYCSLLSHLQRHLLKHTKERPFVCRYVGCGKSFTQRSHLKRHIKTHHNDSPLEQECESLELNNGNVQQQEVLHCDWKNCNREFNDITLLINHIKKDHIGKGKSRYECQWRDCSYATVKRSNIDTHIRMHTKERPFICSYNNCGQSFSQKGHLNQHMDDIHLSKCAFHCPLLQCDKKFSRIDAVYQHLLSHAAASNYSFSNVDSICNALRKKIPYPVDISNRVVEENTQELNIDRMDEFMNESNQKQTERNADYSETSTNIAEGDISCIEVNEIYFSEADLDSIFSELLSFDETVTNDQVLTDHNKDKMDAANVVTECISFAALDKDRTHCSKRPFDFENEFDYASKKIKSTHLIDSDNLMDCEFDYSLSNQNSQTSLSVKTALELFHSISNELDAEIFIEQYLETL